VDQTHLQRSHEDETQQRRPVAATTPTAPVPLRVGAADDRAEIEADRRADQVLARLSGDPDGHAHPPGCDHGSAVRRSPVATGAVGLAGGPLDHDTEARITSRLGAGRTIDASVRRQMEGAFGRSFSGVRVHEDGEADQLNRQLSSTAFTVGQDVFFRAGAYRPDDSSGQRLLAHELAHVEQDGGGARRTVHRAVGFEFETPIQVKRKRKNGFEAFKKMDVIKQYRGFRMEADESSDQGSAIEFVVDPPVGEQDRDKLVAIMTEMTAEAERIQVAGQSKTARKANAAHEAAEREASRRAKERSMAETGRLDTYKPDPVERRPSMSLKDAGIKGGLADAWIRPASPVVANPQVTGGIALDKIIDMMEQVGRDGDQSGVDASHQASAKALDKGGTVNPSTFAAAVRAAGGFGAVTTPSKSLQGMAALMASYLDTGKGGQGVKPLNYAKLVSGSIMLRTDFASLFSALPMLEQADIRSDPFAFSEWVLGIAGLAGAGDAAVFERGVLEDYHQGATPVVDDDPGLKVSRSSWLVGVVVGHDSLSARSNPALRAKLEGLGRLGNRFDQVGDRRRGAIMEFRGMGKGVPSDQWSALALGIFDYLVGLNAGTNQRATATV
jgi:hypothetical protein